MAPSKLRERAHTQRASVTSTSQQRRYCLSCSLRLFPSPFSSPPSRLFLKRPRQKAKTASSQIMRKFMIHAQHIHAYRIGTGKYLTFCTQMPFKGEYQGLVYQENLFKKAPQWSIHTTEKAPPSASISRETTQSSLVTKPLSLQGHYSKAGLSIDTGVVQREEMVGGGRTIDGLFSGLPRLTWIRGESLMGGRRRRVSKPGLRTIVSLFSVTPSASFCLAAAS